MLTVKKYLQEAFKAVTALGTAYFYGLLVIFLLLLDKKQIALHLIAGLVACYLFVFMIRVFYFKERPKKENHFNLFIKINAASFPSLHSLSSVYVATVISKFIANIKITIFFYSVALLIAYSRIYLKKHYFFDVLSGLILGVTASLIYLYTL